MKTIILLISIFLLSSCWNNQLYEVVYEKCTWITWSVTWHDIFYSWLDRELTVRTWVGMRDKYKTIQNVCDYSKKTITN